MGPQSEHQGDQQGTGQAPTVPQIVPGPPMIDIDAIEDDDDDVVESTASAFAQAKNKSRLARRGPVVVDVESGGSTRLSKNRKRLRSDQAKSPACRKRVTAKYLIRVFLPTSQPPDE